MKAKKKGEPVFPSNEIESLQDIALAVVADNFSQYPELKGVTDQNILDSIVRKVETNLPITVTARNIPQEFYWEAKCHEDKRMKNVKKE